MQKIYAALCFFFLLANFNKAMAQNVGIGTNTPSEKLTVVGNIKANAFKFTSPKILYYSINEAAFKGRNSAETVISGVGNGGSYIANGANYGLHAPVNLPHGAKIIQISFQFYDVSATQDISGSLINEFTSGYSSLASISSSGSVGLNIQTFTFSTPFVVDNSSSSYEILVVPASGNWTASDLAIRSVIIQYTMDETN